MKLVIEVDPHDFPAALSLFNSIMELLPQTTAKGPQVTTIIRNLSEKNMDDIVLELSTLMVSQACEPAKVVEEIINVHMQEVARAPQAEPNEIYSVLLSRLQVVNQEVASAAMRLIYQRVATVEGRMVSAVGESAAEKAIMMQFIRPHAYLFGLFVKHNIISPQDAINHISKFAHANVNNLKRVAYLLTGFVIQHNRNRLGDHVEALKSIAASVKDIGPVTYFTELWSDQQNQEPEPEPEQPAQPVQPATLPEPILTDPLTQQTLQQMLQQQLQQHIQQQVQQHFQQLQFSQVLPQIPPPLLRSLLPQMQLLNPLQPIPAVPLVPLPSQPPLPPPTQTAPPPTRTVPPPSQTAPPPGFPPLPVDVQPTLQKPPPPGFAPITQTVTSAPSNASVPKPVPISTPAHASVAPQNISPRAIQPTQVNVPPQATTPPSQSPTRSESDLRELLSRNRQLKQQKELEQQQAQQAQVQQAHQTQPLVQPQTPPILSPFSPTSQLDQSSFSTPIAVEVVHPGLALKQQMFGHEKAVKAIYFDDSRKDVVSVSQDALVQWDSALRRLETCSFGDMAVAASDLLPGASNMLTVGLLQQNVVYSRVSYKGGKWFAGDKREKKATKVVAAIRALTENVFVAGEVNRIRDIVGFLCLYDINHQSFPNDPVAFSETESKIVALSRKYQSQTSFFVATEDCCVTLYDTRAKALRPVGKFGTTLNGRIFAHTAKIMGIHAQGDSLISYGIDKYICLFDARTPGPPIRKELIPHSAVSLAICSPDAMVYGTMERLYVYSSAEGTHVPLTSKSRYYHLAYDKNLLYATDSGGRIDVFECNFG